MLADVPGKPSAAPAVDKDGTSSTQITVTFTEVTDDGGSDIMSYELQIDDGKGGDFVSLVGY